MKSLFGMRQTLTVTLLILAALLLMGCGDGAGGSTAELDGTWTIATTQTAGGAFGDGSATISFLFTFFVDVYAGPSTVGGVSYQVVLSSLGDVISVAFSRDIDGEDDQMTFDGTRVGNTISGTYAGEGSYSGRTGTFTMTR